MDWSNERYVRLYTRDSVTWSLWPWEARALFCFLLRKVDRAGVVDLGGHDPARAVAALVGMPLAVVAEHLPTLLESGAIELGETAMVMPNYIEAQEAKSSDKQRQSESRGRRRDRARAGQPVTPCDTSSRPVTGRHTESHRVTPSLAEPSQTTPSSTVPVGVPAKPDRPTDADVVWGRLNSLRKSLIPKARNVKLTAKTRATIDARLAESSLADALDVLEHLAAKCRQNPKQAEWFQASTIFRPANYARTLGKLGTEELSAVTRTGLEGFDVETARAQYDLMTGVSK